MQQSIQNKTWHPTTTTAAVTTATAVTTSTAGGQSQSDDTKESAINVQKLVEENAVIVFGRRGCCMCHVAKHLLLGLGVNPLIFCVDEPDEATVMDEFSRIIGSGADDGEDCGRPKFPAVFIGGKMFGGLERVMSTHISGELVPILKEAKALWL